MARKTEDRADPLTHLLSRQAFEADWRTAVAEAGRAEGSVSVGVVDVDLLGKINAEQGREAADALLISLGQRLAAAFPAPARLYRCGGDAFAVIWEGVEKEEAFLRLENFRRSDVAPDGVIGISAGLAAFPDDGQEAGPVLQKACEALYRAKATGRNKSCLPREEKMTPKTSYYTQGQLMGLRRLAEREGISDAELLREALNDLLLKHFA